MISIGGSLSSLRGSRLGEDAFVIGSGKSLESYPAGFFNDRVTIGVNHGWSHKLESVNFMVTKYHDLAREWRSSARVGKVVTTFGDLGDLNRPIDDNDGLIVAKHYQNKVEDFEESDWPTEPEHLVVSWSTITTASHFAAHLGCRTIFLVAADCGDIDGARNISGHDKKQTSIEMLRGFDLQNQMMKNLVFQQYGAQVLTLLPFATPNMDGHAFVSHAGYLNVSPEFLRENPDYSETFFDEDSAFAIQLSDMKQSLVDLERDLHDSEFQFQLIQNELHDVITSLSWRLTKPLRHLRRLLFRTFGIDSKAQQKT